jgi:1-pyrroline-5-carboxylate dehydrogenase
MSNSIVKTPIPLNEPVFEYRANSLETHALKKQLAAFSSSEVDIPLVINGREVRTGETGNIVMPHKHRHKLGIYHNAQNEHVAAAIAGAMEAHKEWSRWSMKSRAAIFLKAAELLSTKYRFVLNGSTMLGQSKTCHQAEIDSACELTDFLRFNVHFQEQIFSIQPDSLHGNWNQLEYRPLEGFVFAVTPFNFTAIGGNLPTAPALMGNVVIWKPASTSVYSNYFFMKVLEEAGLPPGVIQFVPGKGAAVGDPVIRNSKFAGLHFTGSTGTFNSMWRTIAENVHTYRGYPRVVGETGGKDFVVAHSSCDVDALRTALIRGAFEYQGQKCSAASRAYIPKSIWLKLKESLVAEVKQIRMGDISDFGNFMGAVIDKKSFENIKGYIETAKQSAEAKVIVGGGCNMEAGYFVEPTIIEVTDPKYRTMTEEIFGPVLSVYVYEDSAYEETLRLVDETSPYALTGSVFAQDRKAIDRCKEALIYTAGNFYINNKPTGAVVGQQPFGGARSSGTNDKAGSVLNLLRWVSARTISETLVPPHSYRYPFMDN